MNSADNIYITKGERVLTMQKYLRPAAFVITLVSTVLATVMRILLTPEMQDTQTGTFHVSYFIIGTMLISLIVIAFFSLFRNSDILHIWEMPSQNRAPVKVAGVFLGLSLILSSLFDMYMWAVYGQTPPPNETVIGRLDSVSLTFTLIFGILAGIYFLWLAIKLKEKTMQINPARSLAALSPVVWIWVRLVRYQVSYASAIQVERSFYDFVMLIFTMLFLFSFAQHITKINERPPRMLLFYSLCTALNSLSGPVVVVALFLMGETEAFNSSRLAGLSDFMVGIFALCTAFSLISVHKKIEDNVIENTPDSIEMPPEDNAIYGNSPTVDEILKDLYRQEQDD